MEERYFTRLKRVCTVCRVLEARDFSHVRIHFGEVFMFKNCFYVFFISMVPLVELRGAIPLALGIGIDVVPAVLLSIIGNMIPVPFVYFFARKFLLWGAEQRYIGKFCNFFICKGERAGQKLQERAGRGGMFLALLLFVGIPLPGTGAWTGTLGASFLGMDFKDASLSVSLGVVLAGIIMALIGSFGLHVFGL